MGGWGLSHPLEFLQLQLYRFSRPASPKCTHIPVNISLYSLQMCIPHKRGKAAPAPSLTLREVHLENLCICMQFPRTENLIWFLHCENIAKTEFEIELGIWWMLILGSFAVTRLRARPLQGLLSSQSMLVMLPHDMLPLATSYLPAAPLSHPVPSINTLMGLFTFHRTSLSPL